MICPKCSSEMVQFAERHLNGKRGWKCPKCNFVVADGSESIPQAPQKTYEEGFADGFVKGFKAGVEAGQERPQKAAPTDKLDPPPLPWKIPLSPDGVRLYGCRTTEIVSYGPQVCGGDWEDTGTFYTTTNTTTNTDPDKE